MSKSAKSKSAGKPAAKKGGGAAGGSGGAGGAGAKKSAGGGAKVAGKKDAKALTSTKPVKGGGSGGGAKAAKPAAKSGGSGSEKKGAPAKTAPAAKVAPAPAPAKKVDAKKAEPAKAEAPTPAAAAATGASAGAAGAGGAAGKVPPKGITIVSNKPVRKPKPKPLEMPKSEPLLKPGQKFKPLITSGPKAPPSSGIPGQVIVAEFKFDPKAKLPKKDLDKYREILLRKRAELFGDVSNIENEALRGGNSGSLSNLPQHMAEQGSDAFDQALSLDIAQVDRNLIKEIDEALQRIEDGSFGICQRTGKRITAERLAEVPWAKYSIEAAREMETRRFSISPRSAGGGGGGGGGDED